MIQGIRMMDVIGKRSCLSGWLALGCVLLCATGCQVFKPEKKWSWPWENKEGQPLLPDRILPIWTDTILHQPGKSGIRGFGGRVFFYAGEESDAIEVDGGLIVYVFDTDNMDPHSPEPEKKYVFTPDQFKGHMSTAPMGKSYSVWLPWDEVGGESRSLTLVARFEGRNGGVVLSQPTVKFLPGLSKPMDQEKPKAVARATSTDSKDQGVTLATFVDAADSSSTGKAGSTPNEKRRETQTISLPPSFYRHIQAPPGSPLADPFQDQRGTEKLKSRESLEQLKPITSSSEKKGTGKEALEKEEAKAGAKKGTLLPSSSSIPSSSSKSEGVSGLQDTRTDGVLVERLSSGQEESLPSDTLTGSTVGLGDESLTGQAPSRLRTSVSQRYPFRHIPGVVADEGGSMETVISGTRPNRTMPMKGGWLEGLKRTPRS